LIKLLSFIIIESKKKEIIWGVIMRFVIAGRSYEIKREDIIGATKGVRPKPFDGRNRYYVVLHGLKYPPKQPIHLVTGIPYSTEGFITQRAQHFLKKLGFTVYPLEVVNEKETVRSTTTTTATVDGALKFAVTLRPGEDGFIVVSCPSLPGCHSQGKTEEEAISNIREAIRGYIASMRRHGEEIPNITEVREVEVAV
jgi:antitoxin HicB